MASLVPQWSTTGSLPVGPVAVVGLSTSTAAAIARCGQSLCRMPALRHFLKPAVRAAIRTLIVALARPQTGWRHGRAACGFGADGFHSASTRIGPTIEHCDWEGLLHDDCIAIHGSLQQIVRAEGNKLILEKGNHGNFAVGEPVRISSQNGFFGEFTCTSLRMLENKGGLLELTLDRESGAPAKAKASNPRHNGAGFKILNCKLGNCRSRGILVKADNGLIENCAISGCGMSAISIGPEYYWGEADYSRNVTVRGNTLRNNVLNGSEAGTIFVHGDGAVGNGNITITNNFFDGNYGRIAIHVADTDGILINDNRLIASSLPLPGGTGRTILDFRTSRNIILNKNRVENLSKSDTLVSLGKNVAGITGNDASGIRPDPAQPRGSTHPSQKELRPSLR